MIWVLVTNSNDDVCQMAASFNAIPTNAKARPVTAVISKSVVEKTTDSFSSFILYSSITIPICYLFPHTTASWGMRLFLLFNYKKTIHDLLLPLIENQQMQNDNT